MAYTVTVVNKTVHGNERVNRLLVTTDNAEGNIATGLSYVNGFSCTPGSMSTGTAVPHIFTNVGTTATANAGNLAMSGATSGDAYYITVFGY